MQATLPRHEIVLLGIGHTNAHVLRMWRMDPIPDARLTCVSNFSEATYSGMLPGALAGQYPRQRMEIDLVRLCAANGARLIVDEVTGTILDGHHKTAAAGRLNLDLVPILLLDYLIDDRITVEVWPGCGRTSITKAEVLDMAASGRVFSPKTSRHLMPFALSELAVPLEQLRLSIHSP